MTIPLARKSTKFSLPSRNCAKASRSTFKGPDRSPISTPVATNSIGTTAISASKRASRCWSRSSRDRRGEFRLLRRHGRARTARRRPRNVRGGAFAAAGWTRISLTPVAVPRRSVFRWQSPRPDRTGGPDRPDVSSCGPDIRLCAVSSRCTAPPSPGCFRHDPSQHDEHGR